MQKINITTKNEKNSSSYDVIIANGLFEELNQNLLKLAQVGKIVVITEQKIAELYLKQLLATLNNTNFKTFVIIVKGGEENKSIDNFLDICEECLKHNLSRSDLIIAMGGGVIGDMAGFVASSLLRGIRYINIPTTLLSQVDSCVGGKVAVNSKHGKNLIGAFHQPALVFISTHTLSSLSKRELIAGYAEVIKAAFIQDEDFFEYLEEINSITSILDSKDELQSLINRAITIKAKIVEADEKEANLRAILNFGHSFGHAIEKLANYQTNIINHGEAVAIGMVMAAKFSNSYYNLNKSYLNRLIALIKNSNLPTKINDISRLKVASAEIFYKNMLNDKKNYNDQVSLVISKKLGQAELVVDINQGNIISFLEKELFFC